MISDLYHHNPGMHSFALPQKLHFVIVRWSIILRRLMYQMICMTMKYSSCKITTGLKNFKKKLWGGCGILNMVRTERQDHTKVKGIKKALSFVFILAEACTLTNPVLLLLVSRIFLQIFTSLIAYTRYYRR